MRSLTSLASRPGLWTRASGVTCAFCLVTPGCWERCYDAEPSYQWDVDTPDYCDGDQVKSRQQCMEGGEYQNGSYIEVVRDCGAIGAKCRAGVCVSRDAKCPAKHQSFCDSAGVVHSCVGDAVEIDTATCADDQRCIEVLEGDVTRAQCALSDVPCSRERAQCEGNAVVSCLGGLPVSRRTCTGFMSSCVEEASDFDNATCLAPECDPGFSGWLCDEDRIIECTKVESFLHADCGAENMRCVFQADTPFCSATDELATLQWQQIPGGTFVFGNQSSERSVDLPGFEILAREVTVAQYQTCVDAGGCASVHGSEPRQFSANLPLVSVSYHKAQQFCVWLAGRLPAETEWQYVATNLGTTRFPWGDAPPSCELAVLGSPDGAADATCRGASAEGCSMPDDRTALGVCDLAGNVSELVVVPGRPDSPYELGGSYATPAEALSLLPPGLPGTSEPRPTTGFRCVR